jgi:glycosyltransferase involved in cell wall biosynthesis
LAVSKEDYYLSSGMTAPNLNPLSATRLRNAQPRRGVCFYVRASTERRGFDIAFMTINVLKREYPQIPIYTVGMRANELETLKGCTHLGIMSVKELQKVYSEYAAYVVLSFTNYSLLPAEIIACGGKVIDIKVPSNEASQKLFDPAKYQLCDPDPYKLAYQIATLAGSPPSTDTAPSHPTTWQQEYGKIGNALLEQFGRTPKRQID